MKSLRSLARTPGFAVVAILSLAVGIGANTAIFSIVNSLLLRPRPVPNPHELVDLYVGHQGHPFETSSYPSYLDIRERNGVLRDVAAYGIRQFKFTDPDRVEQVWGEAVSGNYFDVLGVQLLKGLPGGDSTVVIGYALWQRRFNGDPNVVGQVVGINGQQLTIAGVAPPKYTGLLRGLSSDVWIPIPTVSLLEPDRRQTLVTSRGSRWLVLFGRLKPDVTLEQATARFDLLSREMQNAHPEEWRSVRPETGAVRELFVTVVPEREGRIRPDMRMDAYALAALMMAIVNVVLLIACMNLAGMLLARAANRRKEFAIRLALGAGRWRLVRQLIAESVLLALIAGASGMVLTIWVLHSLVAFMPALPEGIRLALDLQLDWRVLAYTLVFSTLTGVLFGLVPALQSSKPDVSTALTNDANTITGSYRKGRGRRALVVLQVAFSLLLLISAGLVIRSLEKIRPTRLGFATENILVVPLTLDESRYDRTRSQEFYRQLSERVAALPGVRSASFVEGMPGGFLSSQRKGTEIDGYQPAEGERLEIDAAYAGPRYFTNMGVPIVQGRDFGEGDHEGAPCVAIVNEAFVKRYLTGGGPVIGRRLAKFEGDRTPAKRMCDIVGVIRDDSWQSLNSAVRPFYALALYQSHDVRMSLLIQTDTNPALLIGPARLAVQALDPTIVVTDVTTLNDYFAAGAYPFKVLGIVIGACGVVALLLAAIGIYGIVSHSVAQRTREVGIRVALGAPRRGILRMVVKQGMMPVIWGLAIGLLLSFALTRVLVSSAFEIEMLFGVSATDSLTFVGVTMLLFLVALLASWIPARRATAINPLDALRSE